MLCRLLRAKHTFQLPSVICWMKFNLCCSSGNFPKFPKGQMWLFYYRCQNQGLMRHGLWTQPRWRGWQSVSISEGLQNTCSRRSSSPCYPPHSARPLYQGTRIKNKFQSLKNWAIPLVGNINKSVTPAETFIQPLISWDWCLTAVTLKCFLQSHWRDFLSKTKGIRASLGLLRKKNG